MILRVALLLLLAVAVLPAAAQTAPATAQIDAAKAGQWIPLRVTREDLLLFPAEIDGKPVQASLNTAAPVSAIDRDYAQANGIATAPGGEGKPATIASPKSIRVGGYSQAGGALSVSRLLPEGTRDLIPDRVALVLGLDFLTKWIVQIDFDNSRIRFLPRAGAPTGSVEAHLRAEPHTELRGFSIRIGEETVPGVVLDTAFGSYLSLTRGAWKGLDAPGVRVTDLLGFGPSGPRVFPYLRVDGVDIGGSKVDNVPVEIADGPPGGPRGRIGAALLARFNLMIDLGTPNIRFNPRKNPPPPARVTMSGIAGPMTDDGVSVLHVMRGSPAEAAGLKAGDKVCTIDGERVQAAWRGTPKADWALGPAGKRVKLGLCGGREVQLVLAEFY